MPGGYSFANNGDDLLRFSSSSANTNSNGVIQQAFGFTDGVDGFLGFKFTNASGDHFGWATLNLDLDGLNSSATIKEWAYEDAANGSIAAGATGVSAVPLPPSAHLMLLAMGAGGLTQWRARRKQVKAS